MTEEKATTAGTKVEIKPKTITKRASRSVRKFIRRTKQAARSSGPVQR